ncbi:MAG: hypothetical protein ACYDEP_08915 [Acidimicrobiales bacterium]
MRTRTLAGLVVVGVLFLAAGCSSTTSHSTSATRSHSTSHSTSTTSKNSSKNTSTSVVVTGAYCNDLKAAFIDSAAQQPKTPAEFKAVIAKLNDGLGKAARDAPASLRPSTSALAAEYLHLTSEAAAHGYSPSYTPPDASKLYPVMTQFMTAFTPWAKTNCPQVLAVFNRSSSSSSTPPPSTTPPPAGG